ncbi:BREX system serine/threonine kinase PglW [Arthrobacter sp. FW306-07-I]|nr:BREX system serine/threonine kinase PglW [Arthrobacter sp. FW306-07-I]
MDPDSNHWFELGDAATPAERQALEKFKALLPNDSVTYAWSNLTFIDASGRTNEVDVLLLTQQGLFIVELKGWHGTLTGDQQSWTLTSPTGSSSVRPNPYILTDSKAKRLAGLLKLKAPNTAAAKNVPFIRPMVVLHGQDSVVKLDELGATGVWALDGYKVSGLKNRSVSDFLRSPVPNHHDLVDVPRANKIRTLIQAAGLKPTPKSRFVGQYSLEKADPLGEGPDWQDVRAVHPAIKAVRRIRLFDLPPGASAEVRKEIEISAKREYALTHGISHSGITTPLDYLATDSGPALVFDHDDEELALGEFIHRRWADLGIDEKISLIREIGEILQFAHSRRLAHRALTPRQVFVRESKSGLHVSIRDWFTGTKSLSSTSAGPSQSRTSFGAAEPQNLISAENWVYLAPETLTARSELPPIPLDVYGLGALSFFILSGRAPANTLAELQEIFANHSGLDLGAIGDLQGPFVELVLNATRQSEADRTASIDAFLKELDAAVEKLTRPDPNNRPKASTPQEASTGQMIGDRFEVKGRRGSGSTGTVFEVDDYETGREGLILKVARDDAAALRLRDEADILAALDHTRLVRLVEGPLNVDGQTALLLTDAGDETLALRIQSEGPATIEQLESYGADLFAAVAYLDSVGVYHRDIKPANLGIVRDSSTRKPRLVLFDLSLAREPLAMIGSGTRGYLDPYLGPPRRRQYDKAAELYAVAVTLFEMATGSLPWWRDGDAGPSSPADEVVLVPQSFESAIADSLITFFRVALSPDASTRFSDVHALAAGWAAVFRSLDEAPGGDDADEALRDAAADAATLDTLLAEAGLTARAISAVNRLGVATVGELLGTSPMQVNSIRGQGEKTRKEIQRRIRDWKSRLLTGGTTAAPRPLGNLDKSIDTLLGGLVPVPNKANGTEVFVLRLLLGIRTPRPGGDPAELIASSAAWPTTSQVAELSGVSSGRVSQIVTAAAVRWQRSRVLVEAQDEVQSILAAEGGVAELAEVASALLISHGSSSTGDDRLRLAQGLVRAVVEVDARSSNARLAQRRLSSTGRILVAAQIGQDDAQPGDPESLLVLAQELAAKVDSLVDSRDGSFMLLPAATVRPVLRELDKAAILHDDRILRLAVAASHTAALSGRGELYAKTLPAEKALEFTLRDVVVRELSESSAQKRVTSRFPTVRELPSRPELDGLIEAAMPGMRWRDGSYTRVERSEFASVAGSTTHTKLSSTQILEIERQLAQSLTRKSAVTLAVRPKDFIRTSKALTQVFGLKLVDVSAEVVKAVRATAQSKNVDWDVVLRADAKSASPSDHANLAQLVRMAVQPLWVEVVEDQNPLLLTNIGPLLKFGFGSEVATLFDMSVPRPAARWVVAPKRGSANTPSSDGRVPPMGPDGFVDISPGLALALSKRESTISSGKDIL